MKKLKKINPRLVGGGGIQIPNKDKERRTMD